jgi:bacterioferritin-associated ferredoxin
MYVCLCNAITSQMVTKAVADGATTTKKVAAATDAGALCGRCKATIRKIIAATQEGTVDQPSSSPARAGRWLAREPE